MGWTRILCTFSSECKKKKKTCALSNRMDICNGPVKRARARNGEESFCSRLILPRRRDCDSPLTTTPYDDVITV